MSSQANPSTSVVAAMRADAAMIAVVLCASCGHGTLAPAASASVVPNAPTAAYSVADGVRCSANVGAWNGREGQLPDFVVPVKVRIKNTSGRPIRVLYEAFTLQGKDASPTAICS